jgi:hypothetical protein
MSHIMQPFLFLIKEVKHMTREEKLKKIVADPVLWCRYFVRIVDKTGRKVRFEPTYHQKLLAKNFEKFNIVAKSRQLGITSWAIAYSLYLAHTRPDTVCMLMSYSLDTVDIVFKKLKAMYDDLDPSVKIKDVANNRKELILENRSRIVCCVCGSKDQGRGATIRYAHLTEVSSMDDEKLKNQLVAIEAALRPDGQIVLESTSKGMNYWYELWQKAVYHESQYKPFFFSWLDDKRQFIQEYEQNTEIYFNRYGKYLDFEELDEEENSLFYKMDGNNNPLAMKKLMWRRMKIANIGIEKFRQEYPTTASESFLVSGNNVFSLEKIQARTNNIYDSKPLSQKNIKNLSPLMKKWKKDWDMWREPKSKERFYAGVDTGEGIGSDNSVIEIVDQNGIQVFEFASNKIKPYEFADLVREVGNYYGTALLVVEKLSAGHTVVDKLYDGSHRYIRLYKYKEYDAKGKARKKPGFQTSSKSRPIIINRFVEMFETGQILLNSKKLLDEMKSFQLDDTGKQQAVKGAKDDRVMAFAMALEGLANGIWYI